MKPEQLERAYGLYKIYTRGPEDRAMTYKKTHGGMTFPNTSLLNDDRYRSAREKYWRRAFELMHKESDDPNHQLSKAVQNRVKNCVTRALNKQPKSGDRIGPFSYLDERIKPTTISGVQSHCLNVLWYNVGTKAFNECIKPEVEQELIELGVDV